MIRIIQNSNILNNNVEDNSIIFSSSLKLKKNFINKDVIVITPVSYLSKLVKNKYNKNIIDNTSNYIFMLKSYTKVKDKLTKYMDIKDLSFINDLISTYSFYKENKLNDNDKIRALKLIYDEYEKLLNDNNFITKYQLYELSLNIIDDIKYQNIYFDNITKLNIYEINFINKLKAYKNVYLYANTINNLSLIKDLNKITDTKYTVTTNNDVNHLFDINIENLFSNTKIVSCNDLYEEVKYVSNEIRKDINHGLNFKDILVISSDTNRYENYFKLLFNFPYREKNKTGALTKNFLNIFSKIIKGDFSSSTFISLIKLGLLNIDDKSINELDNYVYMWSLEDTPFYQEFKFNPSGKRDFLEYDYKKLNKLNDIKFSIINPIRYFISNIVGVDNTSEILKNFFIYMDEEGIASKLYLKDNDGYNNLIDLLEKINDCIKECDINTIFEIIYNNFKICEKEVKLIDEVNILNLKDYRSDDYKKVYFIGVTEKSIFTKYKYPTLISKNDISNILLDLINKNRDLEKNQLSNVFLNSDITITYHKLDDSMSKVSFSPLLKKFKNKSESFIFNVNKKEVVDTNLTIKKEIAEKLYGNTLTLSPSSLEMFSKCKYSYFLNYGLRLNIKEKLDFDNREVGTFIHYILENCFNNKVDYDNVNELVDKYVDLYFKTNLRDLNETLKYVIGKLKESTIILINNLLDELSSSKFNVLSNEFKIKDISSVIDLDNGKIIITGIVDRIDYYIDENNFYYRVIDYKTGVKKFRLDDVLIGLNMQMIIYLMAIYNSNISDKNIIPTGFLYHPALVHYKKEANKIKKEESIDSLKDSLKANGIINSNYLSLYDLDLIGKYLDVTSRGNINDDKVLSTNEFNTIFKYIKELLKKEGNSILSGEIYINPIKDGKNDSCKYCKFSSICNFDENKNKPRRYKSIKNREALSKMEGEDSGMD